MEGNSAQETGEAVFKTRQLRSVAKDIPCPRVFKGSSVRVTQSNNSVLF